MISKEQFEAAKFVARIKDDYPEIVALTYEQYEKVAKELERLNQSPQATCIVCLVDPSHDVEVTVEGRRTSSSKTDKELDSEWRDEWYRCPVCKSDENIIDFCQYEEFENLVKEGK